LPWIAMLVGVFRPSGPLNDRHGSGELGTVVTAWRQPPATCPAGVLVAGGCQPTRLCA